MILVQMSPERIFRYETDIGEAEFRETMKSLGFSLFIEIPEIRSWLSEKSAGVSQNTLENYGEVPIILLLQTGKF